MEKEEIKILQFCDNYYPQIDGVIKVVDNSSKIMNEWGTVKVVVPKYRKNFYDDSSFPYDVLRAYKLHGNKHTKQVYLHYL